MSGEVLGGARDSCSESQSVKSVHDFIVSGFEGSLLGAVEVMLHVVSAVVTFAAARTREAGGVRVIDIKGVGIDSCREMFRESGVCNARSIAEE